MANQDAYLAHIVAQMHQNVAFLVSQNHIAQADADIITSRLPAVQPENHSSVSGRGAVASALHAVTPSAPAPPTRRMVPPPPPTTTSAVQARAIWAYSGDAGDLSFGAGDVVEIVEETNADWWTGKSHGRQGLFPSNYVEKISAPAAIAPPQYSAPVGQPPQGQKAAYRPFMAAHHGADAPPPAGGVVNSVGLQEAPGQEQKKKKFGKLGNTMANSAAGGVGFGAGAAIGGGLVRAIF